MSIVPPLRAMSARPCSWRCIVSGCFGMMMLFHTLRWRSRTAARGGCRSAPSARRAWRRRRWRCPAATRPIVFITRHRSSSSPIHPCPLPRRPPRPPRLPAARAARRRAAAAVARRHPARPCGPCTPVARPTWPPSLRRRRGRGRLAGPGTLAPTHGAGGRGATATDPGIGAFHRRRPGRCRPATLQPERVAVGLAAVEGAARVAALRAWRATAAGRRRRSHRDTRSAVPDIASNQVITCWRAAGSHQNTP